MLISIAVGNVLVNMDTDNGLPNHYLNLCWFIIIVVLGNSPEIRGISQYNNH